MKATPAPKQFIDEQATKQANLKVSPVLHDIIIPVTVFLRLFFLSQARQQQLRTLEEHRRQLLEVQRQQQQQQSGGRQQQARSVAGGCDNDKPDSEMRREIKHHYHGTDERLNLLLRGTICRKQRGT